MDGTTGNGEVQTRKLTRIYRLGAAEIIGIREIDLSVRSGEMLILKGNSGSGKSTLLSLISGLDRPTSGSISVGGRDLGNATESQLTDFRRKVIGIVFQSFNLLPTLSVLENVCLPALLAGKAEDETRDKAFGLIRELGLELRLRHLPAQISGGEMQRTAIARALINDPAIILADEPTGNLDSRSGEVVIELLASLNRELERTVIIATHSSLADRHATSIIHLKDGMVAGSSTCTC